MSDNVDNTERTLHRPKQLESAQAYQIVYNLLDKMRANDAFISETMSTQKQLDIIIRSMTKGVVRCVNSAYTKPVPRKKAVTPITGKRRRVGRERRTMDES